LTIVSSLLLCLFSVAPPERPTAPKPGQQQQLPAAAFNMPQDAVLGMSGGLGQPSVMGMPHLPSSEAPKLKDFLPFMKPGSFGPKAAVGSRAATVSNDCAPGSAGSLPASVAASPVHLPQAPVSFPPSPQRQPPGSVTTSNSYSSGTGFVHADAGYPIAEALLSPTAPPGAPRSASPAHQLPPTVSHPGGPAETQQQPSRPMDMSYNIPQNNTRSSVGQSSMAVGMPMPAGIGSHASSGYADQNGHSVNSQSYMQVIGQPPTVSMPVHSGPKFIQPGMSISDMHTQHALPSNTCSFPSHVPSVISNAAAAGSVSTNTHPQHSNLPYSSVDNVGTSLASANLNQSYPGSIVAAGTTQQPNVGTTIPGVPVQQVNNSNNVHGQFPSVTGSYPSNIEVSKPHYYQTPAAVPPTCTAVQLPYQSVQPRPPSYEAVTQQYAPPTQQMHPGYPSTQPGFTRPPTSVYVQPGLSSAGVTAPVQPSYHGVNAVHPDVSYSGVHAGHLPASNQQPVSNIHPQHTISAQPQQLPAGHQFIPATSQRPQAAPQHSVMPTSAAYMDQQASQNQPRYPLASQTVPGLPVPSQHPSGVSHAAGHTPSQAQFTANAQMPATQPQPRYPAAPNISHPYPAGVQQLQPSYHNAGQPPAANQMQPMHTAASHVRPAVTSHQQQYQQYPVHPSQPEVGHAPGYLPGNLPQPRYPSANQAYQASNQPPSVSQQPPSQPLHYQSFIPQQQPLYHPGSSQPPVINHSTTVCSNFTAAQTLYSQPHQPQTSAPYGHNVNNAPGEMQAFADIPVCLPSPLQPSRVTKAEVSKNVESLSELDLSGKTTSLTDDAQPNQKDLTGKLQSADTVETRDEAAVDSSAVNREEQREKSEEETRRSLRQSHTSRDVYADSDTLTRFVAEVEKFQKHVDSLVKPTLGGYFPLDKEWKVSFIVV